MSVAVFNTYAFVKRLTAAGMPEAQAEVLADEQMRLIDERLATKEDIAKLDASTKAEFAKLDASTKTEIARLEAATKAEFARLESATKADIAKLEGATKTALAETKADILKWMAGMIGFQTVVILGAVFGLVHLLVR